jgi:uncharacterized protein YjiS (DUF1127 family)
MTILTLRRPVAAGAISNSGEDRVAGRISLWRHKIARWIARSRQRCALREIAERNDLHLLKDIGVSQQEAFREAEKPFWRA